VESVLEVLRDKHGRATYAELVAATSKRHLSAALKSGVVERLARGIYVLPGALTDITTSPSPTTAWSHT
jgi:hypothetical protein